MPTFIAAFIPSAKKQRKPTRALAIGLPVSSTRGKEKVSSEINIYTTVYNLKRLIDIVKIENIETIIEMIRSYKWRLA